MKPILKLKENGYINIELLINSAIPVDLMLSERRDEAAATAFFKQAIDANGFPKKIVIMEKWCKLYRAGEYQFFADACWFSELYRNTPG